MLQGVSEFFNSFSSLFDMIATGFTLIANMIGGWFSAINDAMTFSSNMMAYFPNFLQAIIAVFTGLAIFALAIKLCPFVG